MAHTKRPLPGLARECSGPVTGIIQMQNRRVERIQESKFSDIANATTELVASNAPISRELIKVSQNLLKSRVISMETWTQGWADPETANQSLPAALSSDTRRLIRDQILEGCEILHEVTSCREVGVRLAALHSMMCPRFHIDNLQCRLMITLSGEGTEWIPNQFVDWDMFYDLSDRRPPIRTGAKIEKMPSGYWYLLKGGAWEKDYPGIVHRSPNSDRERLLLSLDPILDS